MEGARSYMLHESGPISHQYDVYCAVCNICTLQLYQYEAYANFLFFFSKSNHGNNFIFKCVVFLLWYYIGLLKRPVSLYEYKSYHCLTSSACTRETMNRLGCTIMHALWGRGLNLWLACSSIWISYWDRIPIAYMYLNQGIVNSRSLHVLCICILILVYICHLKFSILLDNSPLHYW